MNRTSTTEPITQAPFACVSSAWQANEGELLGYLRHRLADADAADDVLQDVFVKAMRHGQGFCTLDNPRAWLFQVARNALVDRARTAHPTEPLPEGQAEPAAPLQEAVAPVDALADCLSRSLGELSPDDAAILRACDLEGQTQRSFADAHGMGLPATKSRLLRAAAPARQAHHGLPGAFRRRRQRRRPCAAPARPFGSCTREYLATDIEGQLSGDFVYVWEWLERRGRSAAVGHHQSG
jgi:RNA polymerase sigma-70 factor (ECF subfamily)